MRIITGLYSGLLINFPKGLTIRPTMDFAKEGLFNILNHRYHLNEFIVLDLFAGSGSVSFEFVSNSVNHIHCVDTNLKIINHLKNTAFKLKCNNITMFKNDALRFLKQTNEKYNLIFADPPYDYPNYLQLIETVFSTKKLLKNGILIVEHDKKNNFAKNEAFTELRTYGKTNFSFFTNKYEE